MKRKFSRIGLILTIILIIVILIILSSYINHKIHLSKEDKLFVPNGMMVEVNGHKMHVYAEGKGDETLVLMSGGGTSSPVLDFKSLYSLLSDKYKIVVVEKAGYGFSEVSDVSRDIDTVLNETREALSKTGISGPFILMPHSMSGIEALFWAQKYPDEVKAIIGLDMSVPESYENFKTNISLAKLGSFVANAGITRWIPGVSESDAIKYGTLTDKEKELYKIVFYRRTATSTMINELQQIKSSAIKVGANKVPEIPILIFSSNGEGTGWKTDEWKRFQKDFINEVDKGRIIDLNCSHYVQDIEYKRIAREAESFIDSLHGQ